MTVGASVPTVRLEADAGPITLAVGSVKIDGLRQPEHAAAAAGAGADLLGFVFAPARRRVTPEQARSCIAAARAAAGSRRVITVGVFVDAAVGEMNDAAGRAGLDLLQLHGDEPPESLTALDRPVIKAIAPPSGSDAEAISRLIDDYAKGPRKPIAFVIDGYSPTSSGGTGVRADWALAGRLATRHPILLAGGLDAENVGLAISTVRPLGVDVSSGVETDGGKDASRIAAFVAAAKLGFRTMAASGRG